MNRRSFIKGTLGAAAGLFLPEYALAEQPERKVWALDRTMMPEQTLAMEWNPPIHPIGQEWARHIVRDTFLHEVSYNPSTGTGSWEYRGVTYETRFAPLDDHIWASEYVQVVDSDVLSRALHEFTIRNAQELEQAKIDHPD